MPDSASGGAAFLAGQEIVNDARTLAYLDAGFGPEGLRVSGGCACPRIRELIECGSEPYASPASDPAPWYDSSVPESADFAGFLTVEFEGLGSTYTRTNTDKTTGGAVLGRLRAQARTMVWRGYLFGRSDCAVTFGLSWLTANLRGPNCFCDGEDLDLMICCPELAGSPAVSGCGEGGAIQAPAACSPYSQPDAFRTLKNVGLIEGPKILSQRKIGCSTSCGNRSCPGDTLIMEVEFTLVAGNPFLYGCPVGVCTEQPFPINPEPNCPWVKWTADHVAVEMLERERIAALTGTTASSLICNDSCQPEDDCTFDKGCLGAVLPKIPAFEDRCFCEPVDPINYCCSVPADAFGQFFEGAPIIEIYSGSKSMRATTVRFFSNPQGLECSEAAANPCLNCDSIQIRYIPADSTMVIDGTTRTVTVQCPGMTAPILADHLTVTPFSWPLLQCMGYCVCVETEGAQVDYPNATVSVFIVPREM